MEMIISGSEAISSKGLCSGEGRYQMDENSAVVRPSACSKGEASHALNAGRLRVWSNKQKIKLLCFK
jgi:hypothetical protein